MFFYIGARDQEVTAKTVATFGGVTMNWCSLICPYKDNRSFYPLKNVISLSYRRLERISRRCYEQSGVVCQYKGVTGLKEFVSDCYRSLMTSFMYFDPAVRMSYRCHTGWSGSVWPTFTMTSRTMQTDCCANISKAEISAGFKKKTQNKQTKDLDI